MRRYIFDTSDSMGVYFASSRVVSVVNGSHGERRDREDRYIERTCKRLYTPAVIQVRIIEP